MRVSAREAGRPAAALMAGVTGVDSVLDGEARQLDPIRHPDLLEHVGEVVLDGRRRDGELLRDVAVGASRHDGGDDVELTRRKRDRDGGAGAARRRTRSMRSPTHSWQTQCSPAITARMALKSVSVATCLSTTPRAPSCSASTISGSPASAVSTSVRTGRCQRRQLAQRREPRASPASSDRAAARRDAVPASAGSCRDRRRSGRRRGTRRSFRAASSATRETADGHRQ